jgi:hypothetical protein
MSLYVIFTFLRCGRGVGRRRGCQSSLAHTRPAVVRMRRSPPSYLDGTASHPTEAEHQIDIKKKLNLCMRTRPAVVQFISKTQRLNMELDIQSLLGLLCTAVLIWLRP